MITRRDLLRGVAGTAALLGWPPGHASGEPPPETTKLRLLKEAGRTCWAPQYVAEDLLRAEGLAGETRHGGCAPPVQTIREAGCT